MTKAEAEKVCDSTAIAQRVIASEWSYYAQHFDVSELEEEGVMFEALLAVLLYGLMSMAEAEGIDFEQNLRDAREMEAEWIEAHKTLIRVNKMPPLLFSAFELAAVPT